MKIIVTISLAFLLSTIPVFNLASQEVFSIDRPSGAPFAHGDILEPGPILAFPDFSIAIMGALSDAEINGLSSGDDFGTELLFSVDGMSMGLPMTDVSFEAAGGATGPRDQAADIYRNPIVGPGSNFLYRDGDGIPNPLAAPDPALGLTEPFSIIMDNTDAYDAGDIGSPGYAGPIFFSVGAAATGGFPTDAILVVPTPGAPVLLYAGGFSLSLAPEDDIDAIFVLDDGDLAFFGSDFVGYSLERGSPSLAAGSPLSLAYAGGGPLSPADVFIATGSGGRFLVPAASHGLRFEDNVDALDQVPEVIDEVILGDVNMDGVVNLLDVAPFVELLATGDYQIEADINEDGLVNLLDVGPFVDLLSGS